MNDSIVCYAAQGDTPRELWATNVGFGYEHAPSMQVEKEGVMFWQYQRRTYLRTGRKNRQSTVET